MNEDRNAATPPLRRSVRRGVREIVEQESARILGPMGASLVQQAWVRRRPRGMEGLLPLLREIGGEMEDPDLVERYVERVSRRVREAARAK